MQRPTPKKPAKSNQPDPLTLLAIAALRNRRRRSPAAILVLIALLVAFAGLFVWFFWPTPQPRRFLLVAFDAVARPDEAVTLRAQLEPLDTEAASVDLSNYPVYFKEPETGLEAKATTRPDGAASVAHAFPAHGDQPIEYLAQYAGDGSERRGAQGQGRVFVWPAETVLLVVDADHALADADEATFETTSNLDVKPLSGAVAALQGAAAKYHIAYLTAQADRPTAYFKRATWVKRGWVAPRDQFPDGPVLGRASVPDAEDAAAFQRTALQRLREQFPGAAVGVVRRAEEARLYQAAGLRTFLVGEAADAPEGVTVLPSWAELADHLQR